LTELRSWPQRRLAAIMEHDHVTRLEVRYWMLEEAEVFAA
jgi:hypothetical protein